MKCLEIAEKIKNHAIDDDCTITFTYKAALEVAEELKKFSDAVSLLKECRKKLYEHASNTETFEDVVKFLEGQA